MEYTILLQWLNGHDCQKGPLIRDSETTPGLESCLGASWHRLGTKMLKSSRPSTAFLFGPIRGLSGSIGSVPVLLGASFPAGV